MQVKHSPKARTKGTDGTIRRGRALAEPTNESCHRPLISVSKQGGQRLPVLSLLVKSLLCPMAAPVTHRKVAATELAACAMCTGGIAPLCLSPCLSGTDNLVRLRAPSVAKQPETKLKGKVALRMDPLGRVWQML